MPLHRLLILLTALCLSRLAAADPLWIDVRSPEEYAKDHIEGDPNVHYTEIGERIASLASAKDAEIVLYCAVGGRAGIAKRTLESLGYTRVRNAGGIDDAREERGCDTPQLAANCSAGATP